jgi:HD-GYP domain-containing protein (c-di-GMP phosphodiesterase class II)
MVMLPQRSMARRRAARAGVVAALSRMAVQCGRCEAGQVKRTADAAVLLAAEIGMGRARREAICQAAMLLDIGMVGVPAGVTHDLRPLAGDQYTQLQLHPMRSLDIVSKVGLPSEVLAGIMHHHERFDGRGYPMGFAGHEIPEFARILAIADAFAVMTRRAPPGAAGAVGDPVIELTAGSGTRFDPVLADAFVQAVTRQRRLGNQPD